MQLICHSVVTKFSDWNAAFDDDAEARRDAGLSVLQIWHDADDKTHAFVLMEVNDRARAQGWIDRSAALVSDDKGTVVRATAFFIETA